MEPFFTINSKKILKGKKAFRYSCSRCGLSKGVLHPKIKPWGNFRKKIMCIGEAPGKVEDSKGKPWQGKVGTLLRKTLYSLGVDLEEDCLSFNAVNCRPPDNRKPTINEIANCKHVYIDKVFEEYKPRLILLFGGAPLESIIGSRWPRDLFGITTWSGYQIPDRDYNAWICPQFHPSFVARSDMFVEKIWKKNLESALKLTNVALPSFGNDKEKIKIIDDLSILDEINTDLISFDYETTGLKPYKNGHRIVAASVGVSKDLAYAFLVPKDKKKLRPFFRLLRSNSIGKMAHNLSFEHNWTKVIFGFSVRNWVWDSMLASHVLDNRSGTTSLKFQVYVNFGVVDYESRIDKYLRAKDNKDSNTQNRILEILDNKELTKELLIYNGLDSLYQYRLALLQMKEMKYVH